MNNHLGIQFPTLITYSDDPIIIHVGYQSLNTNTKICTYIFFDWKTTLTSV
jgi:hypothetical protein